MRSSSEALAWGLAASVLLAFSSCGYATRPPLLGPSDWQLHLAPIVEEALDLDAGAEVDSALRRHLARRTFIRLEEDAANTLVVALSEARVQLAARAEPALRAPRYVVKVALKATLVQEDIKPTMSHSFVVAGEDEFTAPAGSIEALDGAQRASLARAADEAADRLVNALVAIHFRVSTSSSS